MQITFVQDEIEAAVIAYLHNQIALQPNQEIKVDLRAGRGENGFSATVDVRPPELSRTTKAVVAAVNALEITGVDAGVEVNDDDNAVSDDTNEDADGEEITNAKALSEAVAEVSKPRRGRPPKKSMFMPKTVNTVEEEPATDETDQNDQIESENAVATDVENDVEPENTAEAVEENEDVSAETETETVSKPKPIFNFKPKKAS